MFEHLTSPLGQFATVSKLRTARQQMNRAFAAEFLAPHERLRGNLSGATIGEDELDDLAADDGVSVFVIRHQIGNHNLAQVLL
jgi:Zn-dependent peptidase ImmA (M78 family)